MSNLQKNRQSLATKLTLLSLNSRIDAIETRTTTLETQQFAPITKLTGLAIFAVNAGGFNGDRIIAPSGAIVSRSQPNPTSLHRVSFDFNTSFSGTDLLKLRSNGAIVTGTLRTVFSF